MSVTQYYKKYIAKLCAEVEAELVGERLEAGDYSVENFNKFIARTRRRHLVAKIAELVNEHVNVVLVGDKFGQHFTDCDADSVEAGKDVVALGSFHKSPEKKDESVSAGVIVPPVVIVAGRGAPESVNRTLAVLAELGKAK